MKIKDKWHCCVLLFGYCDRSCIFRTLRRVLRSRYWRGVFDVLDACQSHVTQDLSVIHGYHCRGILPLSMLLLRAQDHPHLQVELLYCVSWHPVIRYVLYMTVVLLCLLQCSIKLLLIWQEFFPAVIIQNCLSHCNLLLSVLVILTDWSLLLMLCVNGAERFVWLVLCRKYLVCRHFVDQCMKAVLASIIDLQWLYQTCGYGWWFVL